MKFKMHDEIIRMEYSQKMLELTTHPIAFSPMNPTISMKRKFNSASRYRSCITSASARILNNTEQHNIGGGGDCEDEDDDSRPSSTLIVNGVLVKPDSKIANDINLPSPPSSTRSSFDGKDSFLSTDEMVMDTNEDSHGSTIGQALLSNESNDASEEQQQPPLSNDEKGSNEDDIKLLVESVVNSVVDSYEQSRKSDEEDLWKNVVIDPEGETILPNGLRVVSGVADIPFYREEDSEPGPRFTNQLNYLKTILTKYICRYKTAMPFLRPVDCVQLKIPNYYLVIREPMDFNTVKNRLNFLWYRSASECISDIRLIFQNCYMFNSPTDYVYSAGKKLEEYFDEKLKEMPANEVEIPCPPRPNKEELQKLCEKIIKKRPDSISDKRDSVDSCTSGSTPSAFTPIKMTTRSERGVMVRKPSKDLPTPISTPQPKPPTLKKVPLNEPMKFWYDFIKELFTKKHVEYAWPFYKPVSTQDYPDYLEKIKKPMDLSTIKQNIETGKYITVNDFAKDMRLMFSNCLRYNTQDSPVIEQARKLREQFEFKYARIPEEWLSQKLVIPKSRTSSPSVRNNSASSSNSHSSKYQNDSQHKSKKLKSDSKKSSQKNRSSLDSLESGSLLSSLSRINGASADSDDPSVDRMKMLEMQVERLTHVLTATLLRNGGDSDQAAIINAIASTTPKSNGHGARVNGQRKRQYTKRQNKRKRNLSSDEDSDDDTNNQGDIGEPFDPEKIEDLKKLKKDLENLPSKDLQNVLRILQSTEPSLRCDEDANVEIDFEALKPKTLVALRKYVTSCMLNATASPSAQQASTSSVSSSNVASGGNKKFCNTLNSVRGNLDTDCDNFNNNNTNNNWSRAGSRASNLQLSESSSSSDSEIDD